MPKLKTHSGVKKRIKITGRGKLMRKCCGNSHLATKKSKERKRRLNFPHSLSKASQKAIKRLI